MGVHVICAKNRSQHDFYEKCTCKKIYPHISTAYSYRNFDITCRNCSIIPSCSGMLTAINTSDGARLELRDGGDTPRLCVDGECKQDMSIDCDALYERSRKKGDLRPHFFAAYAGEKLQLTFDGDGASQSLPQCRGPSAAWPSFRVREPPGWEEEARHYAPERRTTFRPARWDHH